MSFRDACLQANRGGVGGVAVTTVPTKYRFIQFEIFTVVLESQNVGLSKFSHLINVCISIGYISHQMICCSFSYKLETKALNFVQSKGSKPHFKNVGTIVIGPIESGGSVHAEIDRPEYQGLFDRE